MQLLYNFKLIAGSSLIEGNGWLILSWSGLFWYLQLILEWMAGHVNIVYEKKVFLLARLARWSYHTFYLIPSLI